MKKKREKEQTQETEVLEKEKEALTEMYNVLFYAIVCNFLMILLQFNNLNYVYAECIS